jgi:20S proteasome subunit beta 2
MVVDSSAAGASPSGGFDFSLAARDAALADGLEPAGAASAGGSKKLKTKKTGTTIAGVVFEGGVVLGADTRATEGDTVCDKNCEKIHYMAPNIYCCGAGTAADTEAVTGMVSGQLALHRYNTGRGSRVVTALTMLKGHLFKYQGQVSAALVLGGVDHAGPHLHTVYPHGSTDSNPYVTMGSGSLAAMSIFEADYKEGMSRDEAVALVAKAIRAGIFNDLGSGSNVDLCVLTKDGIEWLRNYEQPNPRTYVRSKPYVFDRGTAQVLSETVYRPKVKVADIVDVVEMETS